MNWLIKLVLHSHLLVKYYTEAEKNTMYLFNFLIYLISIYYYIIVLIAIAFDYKNIQCVEITFGTFTLISFNDVQTLPRIALYFFLFRQKYIHKNYT